MENTVQVKKNDGLKRFVSLIDQYFAMGGNQMRQTYTNHQFSLPVLWKTQYR